MPLDYMNSIPLHIQLKKEIENKIRSGEYSKKIPSERELMSEFFVSRSTVRQSIEQLVREGSLEKRRGKGTFVTFKPIDDWLGNLSGTSENIEKMGMIPGSKLIKSEIIILNDSLRKTTGLEKAYHFERVRYANNIAIGIERHYYPVQIGEELNKFDLDNEAFYDLLERELDVHTFDAEQMIKAANPTKEDAILLNIPFDSSVLNVERIITDVNGNFVELENAFYRGDMYSFKIKSSRKSN